jgi:phosphopantetheinyl transferase (holo-ACP synthase)
MPTNESWLTAEVWLATPQAASQLDLSKLDAAERLTWNGLQSPRRRLDWASSRALHQALPDDPRFGLHASLSHSHGYAALARTSADLSIGIDVEWLAPREFLSIASMAFTPEEARELESLGDPVQVRSRFYEFWTLKEAFAKALRMPLADALGKCCFAGHGSGAAAWHPMARHWRAIVYAPRPLLRLAVAIVGDPARSAAWMPTTMEWPPQCEAAWSVVKYLESVGSSR